MSSNQIIKLRQVLSESELSYTKAREGIFLALLDASAPLSLSDLNSKLSVDRSSIYRNLELFTKLNIVSSVGIGWKTYYELGEKFKPHHHHLVCNGCGEVEAIEEDDLEHLLNLICAKRGFQPTDHTFEVRGLCQKCSIVR